MLSENALNFNRASNQPTILYQQPPIKIVNFSSVDMIFAFLYMYKINILHAVYEMILSLPPAAQPFDIAIRLIHELVHPATFQRFYRPLNKLLTLLNRPRFRLENRKRKQQMNLQAHKNDKQK